LGILPFYGIEQIEADYYGEFGMFDEEWWTCWLRVCCLLAQILDLLNICDKKKWTHLTAAMTETRLIILFTYGLTFNLHQ
jgi:hypothetical protein